MYLSPPEYGPAWEKGLWPQVGGSAHGQGSGAAYWGCLVLIATCCALQILGYFDYAFTAIFTVEILLKVTHFP